MDWRLLAMNSQSLEQEIANEGRPPAVRAYKAPAAIFAGPAVPQPPPPEAEPAPPAAGTPSTRSVGGTGNPTGAAQSRRRR